MRYSKVHLESLGYELPPVVVGTDELEERLEPVHRELGLSRDQLALLTGVEERRYWEPGFALSVGAARAAGKALTSSAVDPGEVEVLIYAGVCRELFEPATACAVAARLAQEGQAISPNASIFDVSNACLGTLDAMIEIANRIELGQIRAGLVVSCESAREIVDATIQRLLREPSPELWKCTIATMTGGSGAAAVLLTDGSFGATGPRLLGGRAASAPAHHRLCRWGVEPTRRTGAALGLDDPLYHVFMETDALAVLENGLELAERTWGLFLPEMGWSVEDIDRTVCHQVGSRHRATVLERLGMDPARDFFTFDALGNTGSVAVPLTLAVARERGFVQPGERVALLGIGSGLNCLMLGLEG